MLVTAEHRPSWAQTVAAAQSVIGAAGRVGSGACESRDAARALGAAAPRHPRRN